MGGTDVVRLPPSSARIKIIVGVGRVALGVGLSASCGSSAPNCSGRTRYGLAVRVSYREKAVETVRDGSLFPHIVTTLTETFLGLLTGSVAGILIGIVVGRSAKIRAVIEPFLLVANAFPKVALAPLFLVWFGLGLAMKVAVAFSLVVIVMALTTMSGLRTVRPELVNSAKVMGANSRQIFTSIVFPSIAPWLFSGLKVSLAFSLIGAILGEFIAAQQGIGALIDEGFGTFNSGAVFLGSDASSYHFLDHQQRHGRRGPAIGYVGGPGEQYRP